jgi:hypothetical protein
MMNRFIASAGALLVLALVCGGAEAQVQPAAANIPGPVRAAVRQALSLSAFYKKYVDAKGLPVLGSDKVSDAALLEAAAIVDAMLAPRDDIRRALIGNRVRVAVMAPSELTTDIPEHSDLTPKDYWDKRARGLGATKERPASSCAEENLLNLPGDPYAGESIAIHEFAHTIHLLGLNSIDRNFDSRLRTAYQHAKDKKLWANTYAETNYEEYWAETVQSYFDANNSDVLGHNGVATHDKLAVYDQEIFALIDEVFAKTSWRYVRYDVRHGLPPANNGVDVTIANGTDVEASIYWLGPASPVLYRKLTPGESYDQKTFVGHKWEARLPGRAAIDFVVPTTNTSWTLK